MGSLNVTGGIRDDFFERFALQKSVEIMMKLMPTSIAVLDRDLRVHYINETISKMLGFSLEEARTKRCYELSNKTEICPNCAALEVFETGCPVVRSRVQTARDGRPVYMENHDVPLFGADGTVEKVVELIVDKTKIVQYQKQLEEDFFNLVETLVKILGSKDLYTSHHSFFVMEASVRLAKRFGFDADRLARLRTASLLHDVGKVGIPYSVLNKKARLTDEEFTQIKEHPVIGSRMVEDFEQFAGIDRIIRHHHERYDGMGYPSRLAGDDIPFEARLIAAADSYHAMASRRAYKEPKDRDYILDEFRHCRGTQFDPEVADAFVDMMENDADFAKLRTAYVNNPGD